MLRTAALRHKRSLLSLIAGCFLATSVFALELFSSQPAAQRQ